MNKEAERQVEGDNRNCRWRLCLWMSYQTAKNREVRPSCFKEKRRERGESQSIGMFGGILVRFLQHAETFRSRS